MTIKQERNIMIVVAILLCITIGELMYKNNKQQKAMKCYSLLANAYEHRVNFYMHLSDFYRTKDTTLQRVIQQEDDSCKVTQHKVAIYAKENFKMFTP